MNAEITAIGKVSPVITVLRQLCRNRKTIAIVSSAPSISVCLTPSSEFFDPVAVGVDQAQLDAGRQRLAQLLGRRLDRLAGVDDVGVLLLEDLERDRRHAVDARDRVGLALALDQGAEVGQPSPPCRCGVATTTSANALASRTLPSTRTIASSLVPVSRPTGMSALARCSAVDDSAGVSW